MDADRFIHYIKNPAHLYQISYTELKSLVLQYPYCQNIRYLLLKKSILENHKEYDQNMALAATYSADRSFLFQQIKEKESFSSEVDSFVLKEDYIELKSINPLPDRTDEEQALPESNAIRVDLPAEETSPVLPNSGEAQETDEALFVEAPAGMTDTPAEDAHLGSTPIPVESAAPPSEEKRKEPTVIEEEIEDITAEFDNLFLDIPVVSEPSNAATDHENATPPPIEEETAPDTAISIDELIKLDALSPLERIELKVNKKKRSKKTPARKEENFDVGAIKDAAAPANKKIEESAGTKKKKKSKTTTSTKSKTKLETGKFKKVLDPSSTPRPQEKDGKYQLPTPKPTKKTTKQRKKPRSALELVNRINQNKNKAEKEPLKPKKFAEKSLQDHEDIASETLARLLVKQEQYDKAIAMYEHLSLKFPEKSSFFAEQIENLKNL